MPEEKKPTAADAIANIEKVKASVLAHAGKPGVNPYIYVTQKLDPVLNRLKTGKRVVADENNMPKMVALTPEELAKDIAAGMAASDNPENYTFTPPGLAFATPAQVAATGATSANVALGTITQQPVKPVQT